MATTRKKPEEVGLSRYLSPVAVWALSFGCAVGWGSFVMPGTRSFLSPGRWALYWAWPSVPSSCSSSV